jgi:hypothetical protein
VEGAGSRRGRRYRFGENESRNRKDRRRNDEETGRGAREAGHGATSPARVPPAIRRIERALPQATINAIRHPTYAWRVEALGEADFRSVLEFLEVAGEVNSVDPFPQPMLAALRRLIPADFVSYGEFDLEGPGWRVARVPWEGVPRGAMTLDIRQAHLQFTHQIPHPPWAPFAGRAVRWSDLLSRPKLYRGRAVYRARHDPEASGQRVREARRWKSRRRGRTRIPHAVNLMTTFPCACPSPRYRNASAISLSS